MQEVLYDEIRACVKKWRALSEAMCEDVAEAGSFLDSSIQGTQEDEYVGY